MDEWTVGTARRRWNWEYILRIHSSNTWASKSRLERLGEVLIVPSISSIAFVLQFQKIVDANKSSTLYLRDEFPEELMKNPCC